MARVGDRRGDYRVSVGRSNGKNHLEDQGVGGKKAIPLQVWTGPEGSRRLRLPDFKTVGT